MGSQTGWARDWLRGVADARVALERTQTLLEVRRERALCMGNSMSSGPSGKGGANASEANVIGYVASEEDFETTYAWTRAELDQFDAMAKANRMILRGAILDGLDVTEMKYRIGMTDREIAKKLWALRSKVHYRLAAFVDYLDFIGRKRALHP
ncbi:MAG: hypothetical protein IKG22_12610 [Atopobiaceae bacterium]|nr:hypothetical protein [Atopobiaceae bacterium]